MAVYHRRRGLTPPPPLDTTPPPDQSDHSGKKRNLPLEKSGRAFLVHKLLGPRPTPPRVASTGLGLEMWQWPRLLGPLLCGPSWLSA